MWQVSITELSKQINAPWLIGVVAVVIVLSGMAVDALTTYYNNDFTEEACKGTGITRQLKAQKNEDYEGEYFFEEEIEAEEADEFEGGDEEGDEA